MIFDASCTNPKFVSYFLTTEKPQQLFRFLTDAGAKAGMNLTTVRQIQLVMPPTTVEQGAIAEALSDADSYVESLERLIIKKRYTKQGAMQELLTGKKCLPGFKVETNYKQTELGVIPEDWAITKLGRHATFKTGPFGSALHQSDYIDDGVPVINPMQIVNGRIHPTISMAITEQAARKLSDFRLSRGEIVIGRRGDMGRCALVQPEQHGWLCGTGSMIIRAGASLDGRFLQRVLSSPPVIAAIENASVGSTMVNLNQGTLGSLLISLPPSKAEQEAIAAILSDMDAEIVGMERKVAKARQIKQGMMQELLTGRTRLI
jgi:type I restriction enzyme S subunit